VQVQKDKKRGVFNMDAETKAILEMVDKGHHSEAIREEDARREEQSKRDASS